MGEASVFISGDPVPTFELYEPGLYEPGLEIKIIGVRILLTRVEISVAKRKKSVSFSENK